MNTGKVGVLLKIVCENIKELGDKEVEYIWTLLKNI